MYKETELRKLPTGILYKICETLETNGDWRKLLTFIPKDPAAGNLEPKYNTNHARAIEIYARNTNKLCAEVLFEEWSTSGRVRPTLHMLQEIILQAGIYRAADKIAEILNEPPPSRPNTGLAARIVTYILNMLSRIQRIINGYLNSETNEMLENSAKSANLIQHHPPLSLNDILLKHPKKFCKATEILNNKELIQFDYEDLKLITRNFSEVLSYWPNGPSGKIGSGGFGDVFTGRHPDYGQLAVKKFKDPSFISDNRNLIKKIFNTEVSCLARLRHKNIVPIMGYSIHDAGEWPLLCVVTQYIHGGSVEQKLAEKILTEKQRINIIKGTANALKYIHKRDMIDSMINEGVDTNIMHYIHGNVKSANILLTFDYKLNCQPKLCDFGLAKQCKTTIVDHGCVIGTRAYMAPERQKGMITQKADIFSFGIVLLELLTGLQSLIEKDERVVSLYDHIVEETKHGDISELFDPVVWNWSKGNEIYSMAQDCLMHDYTKRPNIENLVAKLEEIFANQGNLERIVEDLQGARIVSH